MKKFYLLATAVAFGMTTWAQVDTTDGLRPTTTEPEITPQTTTTQNDNQKYRKSVAVKFSPAGLVFGKLQFGGEFNYKRKRSLTFYAGIPMETGIPSKLKEYMFEEEDDVSLTVSSFKLKTMSAMVGYRMYMGKKDMTGFYFEPYIKYVDNKITGSYNAEFDDPVLGSYTNPVLLTSEYSGFGIGAQLGVQFMIAKRVVFDLYLLGPEANMSKQNTILKDLGAVPWTADHAQQMEDELSSRVKDIPLVGEKIDVKVDANDKTATGSYSGFLPGFRGGISVGIRF